MNKIYAFILTFIAGFSTMLGVIPIFFRINKNIILNAFRMSFIVLTGISLLELIPDGYRLIFRHFNVYTTIIIIIFTFLLGFTLTKIMDNKIGEGDSKYYKVGIISMIAMIVHNIPEGIITYITTTNDFKLGLLIAISIMLHNIPEGIIISLPIYYAKKKRGLALLLTFISSLSETIGALLSYLFLERYITDLSLGLIYVFTSGIMIYIALFELFPLITNKKTFSNLHRDL